MQRIPMLHFVDGSKKENGEVKKTEKWRSTNGSHYTIYDVNIKIHWGGKTSNILWNMADRLSSAPPSEKTRTVFLHCFLNEFCEKSYFRGQECLKIKSNEELDKEIYKLEWAAPRTSTLFMNVTSTRDILPKSCTPEMIPKIPWYNICTEKSTKNWNMISVFLTQRFHLTFHHFEAQPTKQKKSCSSFFIDLDIVSSL